MGDRVSGLLVPPSALPTDQNPSVPPAARVKAAWKRWRWRREQRDWEVYLFNHGTVSGWHRTKTLNSITRVWNGWP